MNNLGIKVCCQEKAGKIYFTNKSNDSNIWPVPIFFLKDTIDWLLVFIKDAEDIHDHHTTKSILENNISNQEISNRLHDYLFNKIIISLKKIDDYNWFIDSNPDDVNFTDIKEHLN